MDAVHRPSWPGLSRPSTPWPERKTWMPGTRPGMTWIDQGSRNLAVLQDLRLEREAVTRALWRCDHAVYHRHWINEHVFGKPHVFDPGAVRDRRQQLYVQFREQVRRHLHVPGVGDDRNLTQ